MGNNSGLVLGFSDFYGFYTVFRWIPSVSGRSVGVARGWDPGGGIIMICPSNACRAVFDLQKKFSPITLVINRPH